MCGIIAAASTLDVTDLLIQGLHRMEYRGYDSAGIALQQQDSILHFSSVGKVKALEDQVASKNPISTMGIGHTRWATHGEPSVENAHPHESKNSVFIVHNGIIENYLELKSSLQQAGYGFTSETDSEVIAHLLELYIGQGNSLLDAMYLTKERLKGAYAIAAMYLQDKDSLVVTRKHSPLLISMGEDQCFAVSDPLALAGITNEFIFLEDDDVAKLSSNHFQVFDKNKNKVQREVTNINLSFESSSKSGYKHYMEKEIYEQPESVIRTLEGRISSDDVLDNIYGLGSSEVFSNIQRIQIIACGTSLHAGRTAANWFSSISGMPCQTDYASEYRYKNPFVDKNTLIIAISQSGETADTLAAFRYAKDKGYHAAVAICNVPSSSLVRESEFKLVTNAGPEIGVASTKAFTTQLVALMLLALSLAKAKSLNPKLRTRIVGALFSLPEKIKEIFSLKEQVLAIAKEIAIKENALFLGRGIFYPIAKEGALKLKEISYIHAEAYPAGELKHGPIALIDENMPVIALSPESELAEKLISNLQEVKARGGALYIFADASTRVEITLGRLITMPKMDFFIAPIAYTVPLQMLAYEVALIKGTDIDQPRNLAKSVTVE
jgi:glutamine---fructose-6-phosphate transaminase (isomerizing)